MNKHPDTSIFGACAGCGAVAWELLDGLSIYCLGCDPAAYRGDEDEDDEEYDDDYEEYRR